MSIETKSSTLNLTTSMVPIDETEKVDAKDRVKRKFVEWSLSSTSHGYPNIFRTKNNFLRVMWAIVFVGGLITSIFFVMESIEGYLKFEVTTNIRRLNLDSIDFPAISICNTNPFVTDSGVAFLLDYFRRTYGENISSINDAVKVSPDVLTELEMLRLQAASPSFNKTLRDSFGYSPEHMFFNCRFNSEKCDFSEFYRYYDPMYGNCYRINAGFNTSYDRIEVKKINQYAKDGLEMALFAGLPRTIKSELLYVYMVYSGLRIVVHDQSANPYYTEGHLLKPGSYHRIKLTKMVIETMPDPYSSCRDLTDYKSELYDWIIASNYSYRQFDCFNLCYQKAVILKCGCYDVDVIPLTDASPCSLNYTDHECMIDVYYDFKKARNYHCEDECPLECTKTEFNIEKSFAQFPSRDYSVILEANKLVPKPEAFVENNYEILSQSMVGVEISFANIGYTYINEHPSVTIYSLIADIGGTMGLFIGISLISFIEVIEIIIKILSILTKNRISKKTKYVINKT